MISEAHKHLTALNIRLPSLREDVRYLSGGQRQALAISRATGWGAKLIIMDEPTAALGVREFRAKSSNSCEDLRAADVSVIVISHNVEHVFEISDRIVVFRYGRPVATLEPPRPTTKRWSATSPAPLRATRPPRSAPRRVEVTAAVPPRQLERR